MISVLTMNYVFKDELQQIVQKIKEVKIKLLPESLVREVVSKDVLESLICDRDGYVPMYNEAVLRWLGMFSDDADLNDDDLTGKGVSPAAFIKLRNIQNN